MGLIRPLAREAAAEVLRERWWAAVPLLFAVLAPLLWGVHRVALGGSAKAALDVGLATTWLVGCAVALGVGLRHGPPRAHTVWVWVRPVSVPLWIAAHTLGVLALAPLFSVSLLGAWHAATALNGLPAPPWHQAALLALEVSVLYALGAFLATLTRSALAPLGAVGLWAVGHLGDEYLALAAHDGVPPVLARALFAVVPDLDLIDARVPLVHDGALDIGRLALATLFAAAWVLLLGVLTRLVLSRRDLP